MQAIFEQFVTLWVVIDPIGTIPVFVAVTASIEAKKRNRVAVHAAVLAICVLMFFLVAGQFLIDALGIGLPAFQIAGGLILFLFALTMIFGDSKPKQEISKLEAEEEPESPAVFPLAVPSLASPGAMLAVVLLTDNNRFSFAEQAVTAGILVAVVGVALVLMLMAAPILKLIGTSGAAIVSRVMGMILAAVAVDNVISAVLELIKINTA
ncbi:MarC family protein [Anderseniella sp. Alg231-50]|uniref:MarC family protein n=1 Tax=Anderseniella sp. Alg231-50 TaxID=1922226 RepID=UPI000D551404